MTDIYKDADLAARIVREAGDLAASMRANGLRDIGTKKNVADLVTEADKAAEEYVFETLRKERPEDSILGEEGTNYKGESDRVWVVDPVDGTHNFANDADYWCSALALRKTAGGDHDGSLDERVATELEPLIERNNAVLLGAVYAPIPKILYVGAPGELKTTINGKQVPMAAAASSLAEASVLTYLHADVMGDDGIRGAWVKVTSNCGMWRSPGSSSRDLATIATGRFDLWLSRTPYEWDRLPGTALITANGGVTKMFSAGGSGWMLAGREHLVEEAYELMTS